MDFFDPVKQKKHAIRLIVGYALIGVAVVLATTILLYQARGYWLDKDGRIIQNGLVFVSSHPRGANIYLNGQKHKSRTNARLNLPSGQYLLELKREGYRDWKRILTIEGGGVERFDHPLLIPTELTSLIVEPHTTAPFLTTASPDRRWLLLADSLEGNTFSLFDLETEDQAASPVIIPEDVLAAGSTTTGWQSVAWAKNNRHVLLKRLYSQPGRNASEYVLLDREHPEDAQNLSVILGFSPDKIELQGGAFDRYYLHDRSNGELFTATLERPTPQPYISDVLTFTTEGDIVTFVTTAGAPKGKALIRLQRAADAALTVRQVPADSAYRLDMAIYEANLYLAAGAAVDNRVFVYRDPLNALRSRPGEPLVPVQILKVVDPKLVSFSPSNRMVMAENGDRFAVYDAETDRGYAYRTGEPLDKPQGGASWLDGFRLSYISDGEAVLFDFDGTNLQTLLRARPGYAPVVDPNYRFINFIDRQSALSRIPLLTLQDR